MGCFIYFLSGRERRESLRNSFVPLGLGRRAADAAMGKGTAHVGGVGDQPASAVPGGTGMVVGHVTQP